MRAPLTGIYIQGEGFHRVGCEEDFAQLLEEKLGQDAADMFREYIAERDYRIEELEGVIE